jgi:2-(1,2-epoxy-1,2-dihydrophenyl)acetyl-CoA isomerase
VALEVDAGLARLRLVRPEAANAIDPLWVTELAAAVTALAQSGEVRAVLISAEGRCFSVGGDLRHFAGRSADLAEALEEMVPPYHDTLGHLASLACPVVCAVQGPAAGGGLGLAFCADLVLAAPEARFVCGFARLGLTGDGGPSWFLPRLVGLRRAQELMFANRELTAHEALEWGLITRIVPAAELQDEALAMARRLANGPTAAFASMRRLLRDSWGASLEEQLIAESGAVRRSGATADASEGVTAFAARRDPGFSGR